MFTGIIEAVGRIAVVKPAGKSAVLNIDAGGLDMSDIAVGDSVACNGVCLTVTSLVRKGFTVDVSQETLRVTAGFAAGDAINLEKSLRLSDRLGGHLVSGHVDGVGTVTTVKPVDANVEIVVRFPAELGRYVARKGSIAVNGVSLTVNAVKTDSFSMNLIPHTLTVTNLKDLKQGDGVNLEIDLLARYVERMFDRDDQR
ncbi:MAG TPA: riboflavin synthase [Burkholderiales bacterium]|nr:riboflavin synthase [Burkholderiales bacterium]